MKPENIPSYLVLTCFRKLKKPNEKYIFYLRRRENASVVKFDLVLDNKIWENLADFGFKFFRVYRVRNIVRPKNLRYPASPYTVKFTASASASSFEMDNADKITF